MSHDEHRGDHAAALAPHHRRAVLTVITSTLVVLALVTGFGVFFLYTHLDHNIQAGDKIVHRVAKPKNEKALNILLIGNDTRSCKGCKIDNQTGGGLSDTTILLHVAADRKSAYGISIPRDTLVKPTKCTRNIPPETTNPDLVMWNRAFATGGPDCTAQQVESTFGVFVDSYVTVDFAGFKDMVNAIGGVNVCISRPLNDPKYTHTDFPAGRSVHLDGKKSLAYVRLRHVGDGTDPGRIKRQQTFIAAMINKVVSAGTLARPDRLYRFANALTGSIEASPDLAHTSALVNLAREFDHVDLGHIKFLTVPSFLYPEGSPGYPHVGLDPSAKKLMQRVKNDRPLGKQFSSGAISAGKGSGTPSPGGSSTSAGSSPSGPPSQTSSPGSSGSGDTGALVPTSDGVCR
jgi:LCP family protein required for cell wall assembly